MAINIAKKCIPFSQIFSKHFAESCLKISKRNSIYSPKYIEPVVHKPVLKGFIESGEKEKVAHIPIKPARSEQIVSDLYDPTFETTQQDRYLLNDQHGNPENDEELIINSNPAMNELYN